MIVFAVQPPLLSRLARSVFFILAPVALTAVASTSGASASTLGDGAIAMVGDSLTKQGKWTELLGRPDTINWGHPGYTTGQIAWTFKDLMRQHPQVKVVFLSGGTNDLLLGVPVDRIYANQVDAIHYWRERGVTPVLQSLLHQVDGAETNEAIAALNARLKNHCAAEGVRFLDLTPVLCENHRLRAALSTDGTHLKPEAYPIWADEVKHALDSLGK